MRVGSHMPLQYMLGEWDFDCLRGITMHPPVLIPRPETEELVHLASQRIAERARTSQSIPESAASRHSVRTGVKQRDTQDRERGAASSGHGRHAERGNPVAGANAGASSRIHIVDAGCGSGAISLALLKRHPSRAVLATALDVCPTALALTRENAERVGVADRIFVIEGDVFSCKAWALAPPTMPQIDVLLCNPPYILPEEAQSLPPEVARHESPRALFGGPPVGLDPTLNCLPAASHFGLMSPGADVFLELHPIQVVALAALLRHMALGLHAAADDNTVHSDAIQLLPALGFGSHAVINVNWHGGVCARVEATGSEDVLLPAPAHVNEIGADERLQILARQFVLVQAYTDVYHRPRFLHLQARS